MNRSPLLSLHEAAGARLAGAEPPFVVTYGDVPGEYAAGREGALLLDRTDRSLVRVTGAERIDFLHRILANDVRGLAPGRGNRSLLLTPKGKVLFDFDLCVRPDEVRLSAPPGSGARLAQALEGFHFTEDVSFEDASEGHAPLELVGPRAAQTLERVLGGLPDSEDHEELELTWRDAPLTVTRLPVAGSPGLRVDAGPERAAELWRALVEAGARPGGRAAYDSLRVEALWAEPGVDVDENVYPQEARLERAFDLSKGCYVGQEVVAKIDTYGGLNKRMVALRVSHDDPVGRGTRLSREEGGETRDLGLVTSWAYSFALDGGLVLAQVKRRHQDVGTRFELEGGTGTATIVAAPVRPDALPPTGEDGSSEA